MWGLRNSKQTLRRKIRNIESSGHAKSITHLTAKAKKYQLANRTLRSVSDKLLRAQEKIKTLKNDIRELKEQLKLEAKEFKRLLKRKPKAMVVRDEPDHGDRLDFLGHRLAIVIASYKGGQFEDAEKCFETLVKMSTVVDEMARASER